MSNKDILCEIEGTANRIKALLAEFESAAGPTERLRCVKEMRGLAGSIGTWVENLDVDWGNVIPVEMPSMMTLSDWLYERSDLGDGVREYPGGLRMAFHLHSWVAERGEETASGTACEVESTMYRWYMEDFSAKENGA